MEFSWVIALCAFAVLVPIIFLLFFPDQSFCASIGLSGGLTLVALAGWYCDIDPYLFWLQPIACMVAGLITIFQVCMLAMQPNA